MSCTLTLFTCPLRRTTHKNNNNDDDETFTFDTTVNYRSSWWVYTRERNRFGSYHSGRLCVYSSRLFSFRLVERILSFVHTSATVPCMMIAFEYVHCSDQQMYFVFFRISSERSQPVRPLSVHAHWLSLSLSFSLFHSLSLSFTLSLYFLSVTHVQRWNHFRDRSDTMTIASDAFIHFIFVRIAC